MAQWMFIHGAASSRLTWSRQLPLFPEMIRVDLPALAVSPEALIDRLANWCLDQVDGPVVVVGHSMGGAIAQTMAIKAPERIRGLILVGTGPRLPVNPALLDWLQSDPATALDKIAQWSVAKNADPRLIEKSRELIAQVDPVRAWREFKACSLFDATPALAAIVCPRAVIRGSDDRMTPPSVTGLFQDAWPKVPVYDILDAGHLMMLEQPDAFNQALRDISRGLGDPRSP